MEPLTGITLLVFTGVLLTTLSLRHRWMTTFLWTAFTLRALLMIVNCYMYNLPDSQADARTFQEVAQEWALQQTVPPFPFDDTSYTISWVIALMYRLLGMDILAAHALSVLMGTLAVALGSLLSLRIWNDVRLAQRAGWWLTLFPTLNLYSALTMREAYIWFFFTITLLGVVQWVRRITVASILMVVIGIVGATLYHGAMVVVGIVFLGLLALHQAVRLFRLLLGNRVDPRAALVMAAALAGVIYVPASGMSLPKIGSVYEALAAETLVTSATYAFRGDAAYPAWILPQTPTDVWLKLPLRMIYFLFSPFPWDIRSSHHIIGLLDGFLYLYLAFMIWRGRHAIYKNLVARWILAIVFGVILTFALGVGNFGTGIRHRAKVAVPVVVLAMAGFAASCKKHNRYPQRTIKTAGDAIHEAG